MGLTCFSHLSELLISLSLVTKEEPDHCVLEVSSGQHLIQVAAMSAASLERVLNLQICQIYNLGMPPGVCKAERSYLCSSCSVQHSGNPSVTGTCSLSSSLSLLLPQPKHWEMLQAPGSGLEDGQSCRRSLSKKTKRQRTSVLSFHFPPVCPSTSKSDSFPLFIEY